jgi:argininosuccinate lyase
MEVGGLIHAGRSSWDLGLVSHRVALRESILEVMAALNSYRRTVLDKAADHVDAVMPYYTHGQQAQPTTLAHHLHAFVCAAERDWQRLDGAYDRMNISAAGCAAGTASRFPTNRQRVAELMGFDTVSTNTRDSGYNSDHLWEMGAALACLVSSLDFLCEELILWMGNEFGLVRLADRYCSTSSIMTQKRNPTAAEHVQRISRQIAGRVATSYIAPELTESARRAVESLRLCDGMIDTLKVNRDLMLRRAADSWAQAADLAALLVQEKGLSWRMAHQTVGIMVRLAEEDGIPAGKATPELLDRAAVLFLGRSLSVDDDLLARALDPTVCLDTRVATGSPGPREMERQLAESRSILERDEQRQLERTQRLADAESELELAIDALIR